MCQMRWNHYTLKKVQNVSDGLRELSGQGRANYEARQYNHQIKGVEGCKLPCFFFGQRFGNGVPNLLKSKNTHKRWVLRCTFVQSNLYTSFFSMSNTELIRSPTHILWYIFRLSWSLRHLAWVQILHVPCTWRKIAGHSTQSRPKELWCCQGQLESEWLQWMMWGQPASQTWPLRKN